MGDKNYSRRNFLKKFGGDKVSETDELFEKYSRKQLGERSYSEVMMDRNTGQPIDNNGQTANRNGLVTSGLAPYTGIWGEAEATHLLRRTGFGVKIGDVTALVATSRQASVDALCTFPSTPVAPSAAPLNHYANVNVSATNTPLGDSRNVALGDDWSNAILAYATGSNDGTIESYREQSLIAWSWGVAINDATSIREKMTNFWYHFIPISFTAVRNLKQNSSCMSYLYMKLLRDNALGNFKTLIKAIAKSPAMMIYLSTHYSTATTPNENFGRELMELFTLGKVPTQNYEEGDIKSAAKIFSGWRITSFVDPAGFEVKFNYTYHNQTAKPFGINFGGVSIANQTNIAGANEFDIFFDLLFNQQGLTIAKYICRRLYRFFVYYDIDTNCETNVITPLANLLISNNWEMMPVVKTLLNSEHFFDMANRGVMIKSPLDLLIGTLRSLNINTNAVQTSSTSNGITTVVPQVINQYNVWNYFHGKANSNLEQGYGLVPNVSGWKAYYQEPGFYQNWINTNSIQQRSTILTSLSSVNGFTTGNTLIKLDTIAFVKQFSNPTIQDPVAMVNSIVKYLLCRELDPAAVWELVKDNLLGGQVTASYWTSAWDAYNVASPTTTNTNTVKSRLSSLFNAILQLAEYQLM